MSTFVDLQAGDIVVVSANDKTHQGVVVGISDRDTAGEYLWADVRYGEKWRECFRLPSGKSVMDPNRVYLVETKAIASTHPIYPVKTIMYYISAPENCFPARYLGTGGETEEVVAGDTRGLYEVDYPEGTERQAVEESGEYDHFFSIKINPAPEEYKQAVVRVEGIRAEREALAVHAASQPSPVLEWSETHVNGALVSHSERIKAGAWVTIVRTERCAEITLNHWDMPLQFRPSDSRQVLLYARYLPEGTDLLQTARAWGEWRLRNFAHFGY